MKASFIRDVSTVSFLLSLLYFLSIYLSYLEVSNKVKKSFDFFTFFSRVYTLNKVSCRGVENHLSNWKRKKKGGKALKI